MAELSAHDALKSILSSSYGMDTDAPIAELVASIEGKAEEKALVDFQAQWKQYVQYVHQFNHEHARHLADIDRSWFNNQLGKITFQNVFSNPLWLNTPQDASPYYTLSSKAACQKRIRAEDLLSPNSYLLSGGGGDTLTILTHIETRKAAAKAKVRAECFDTWMCTDMKAFDALHQPSALVHDSVTPVVSLISAQASLREEIKKKHSDEWKKLYDLHGDDLSQQSEAWISTTDKYIEEQRKELALRQKSLKPVLQEFMRFALVSRWNKALIEHCKHVLRSFPVEVDDATEEEAPTKRLRFMFRVEEDKKNVEEILPGFNEVFSRWMHIVARDDKGHELSDWRNTLTELLKQVELDQQNMNAPSEPLQERKVLTNHALHTDLALYSRGIGHRMAGNASVVLQPTATFDTVTLDALAKWEAELFRDTVQRCLQVLAQHTLLWNSICKTWQQRIYSHYTNRAKQLQQRAHDASKTIAPFAPWMSNMRLSDEQMRQLADVLQTCGIPYEREQLPENLSGVLAQYNSWIEHVCRRK